MDGYRVKVLPGTQVVDRSFQTALWWARIELEAGEYEFKPASFSGGFWASIPGRIIEDYFPSNFAGCSVQPYDRTKNAGNATSYGVFRYGFQLRENPTVTLSGEGQ